MNASLLSWLRQLYGMRLSWCLFLDAAQEYQTAASNPEDPRYMKKIAAGPLVEEDDKYMIGSFFLVEATREEAQAFIDNDPFAKASNNTQLDSSGYCGCFFRSKRSRVPFR